MVKLTQGVVFGLWQGVWKPRKIANPDYFEDLHPFRMTTFSAVGLELWSMSSDIFFDNFFVTSDRNTAERWANDGWGLKKAAEGAAEVSFLSFTFSLSFCLSSSFSFFFFLSLFLSSPVLLHLPPPWLSSQHKDKKPQNIPF